MTQTTPASGHALLLAALPAIDPQAQALFVHACATSSPLSSAGWLLKAVRTTPLIAPLHAPRDEVHTQMRKAATYGQTNVAMIAGSAQDPEGFNVLRHAAQIAGIAHIAVLGHHFDGVEDLPFYDTDTVSLLAFADHSFLLFVNGWLDTARDSQDQIFWLEDTAPNGFLAPRRDAGFEVLGSAGFHQPATVNEGFCPWVDALEQFNESDDPRFSPSENNGWSTLDVQSVHALALQLFVALGGPNASISFTIDGCDKEDGTPGGVNEWTESEDIDEDLFSETLEVLGNLAEVEGGWWEYNDGIYNRKSGYSFSPSITRISFDANDHAEVSAHDRLRFIRQLIAQASSDPRLEAANLKDRLLDALQPSHKDTP